MKKLPIIATPEYKIKLPVLGKQINIRPFLVKEEKILLTAMESKDEIKLKDAMIQIIKNCIVTKGIDVFQLSNLDIETIFIELRKKSVSETVDMSFKLRELFSCKEDKCPETKKVTIHLDSLKIRNSQNVTKIVNLNETVGVKLRLPPMKILNELSEIETKTEKLFQIVAGSIESVFTDTDVVEGKDFDTKELIEWVENTLTSDKMDEILSWLSEQPYYISDIKIVCDICQKEYQTEVKGLSDFFTS